MKERFETRVGAESESSPSEVFDALQEALAKHLQNEKAGKPLPPRAKSSLKRALAILGMGLMMGGSEAIAAQQNGDDEIPDINKTEIFHETAFVKGEGRKESTVVNQDTTIAGRPITLTGSATYGGSVFVPEQFSQAKEYRLFNEQSAGAEAQVAEHGPFSFSAVTELEHRPSGTGWFVGGEGAFAFPETGKLEGMEVSLTAGRHFDITRHGELDPKKGLSVGLKGDLKKIHWLSNLPIEGLAYVELTLPGSRESGVAVGIELRRHK